MYRLFNEFGHVCICIEMPFFVLQRHFCIKSDQNVLSLEVNVIKALCALIRSDTVSEDLYFILSCEKVFVGLPGNIVRNDSLLYQYVPPVSASFGFSTKSFNTNVYRFSHRIPANFIK